MVAWTCLSVSIVTIMTNERTCDQISILLKKLSIRFVSKTCAKKSGLSAKHAQKIFVSIIPARQSAPRDDTIIPACLVEQQPPQGVFVCDHAGLAINRFSRERSRLRSASRDCREKRTWVTRTSSSLPGSNDFDMCLESALLKAVGTYTRKGTPATTCSTCNSLCSISAPSSRTTRARGCQHEVSASVL